MVRQARIDLPGHLYHVLGRGIEQRDIFVDHKDYTDFLTRLEEGLNRTGSKCFAFCLLHVWGWGGGDVGMKQSYCKHIRFLVYFL